MPLKALVIFAHPCSESFSAALHAKVVDTLGARGWEVDDCDLNAEGFQPVLTEEERRGYHEVGPNLGPALRGRKLSYSGWSSASPGVGRRRRKKLL